MSDRNFRRKAEATSGFRLQPEGLCDTCANARRITSAKGSGFLLCELSGKDDRYPRYPALPVLACEGYERLPQP